MFQHNAATTAIRKTPDECAELGCWLAMKLNVARGPVSLFLPALGLSELDRPGGPFESATANQALFEAIRSNMEVHVGLVSMDLHINDPVFGQTMAERLDAMIERSGNE
jgi:uncharacterized protein (UPF0261 family)